MKKTLFSALLIIVMGFLAQAHADTPAVSIPADQLIPMPIKVTRIEKQKDGTVILDANFASNFSISWHTFLLPLGVEVQSFFKRSGDEQEEIDRDKFVKIAKNDFWMVWYLTGKLDTIHKAFQFKSLSELNDWYAQDKEDVESTSESLNYWNSSRTKTVVFHDANFKESKVYWYEVDIDKNPLSTDVQKEIERIEAEVEKAAGKISPSELSKKTGLPVERIHTLLAISRLALANGEIASRRFKLKNGLSVIIKDCGVFNIHPNCIVSTIQAKESRGLLSLPLISSPKLRVKPIRVKRKYLEENFNKTGWVCFYNKDTMTLLRVSPVTLSEDSGNKEKK